MLYRLLLLTLLTSSCQSWVHTPKAQSHTTAPPPSGKPEPPPAINSPPPAPPATPAPPQEKQSLLSEKKSINDIEITWVKFDARSHRLIVADQDQLGLKWNTSEKAAEAHGGLAAINGGFFTPEGKPLGLVISQGQKSGTFNQQSSLGSALYLDQPTPRIIPRSAFSKKNLPQNLLQTGPRLVWKNIASAGLSNREKRPRSFLAWDGKNHWAIGHAHSATLSSLATALASHSAFSHIINLDGGRSSDLWVSSKMKGGGHSLRQFWNKNVRNYLILTTR